MRDRIDKLKDELNEHNKEITILKDKFANQIIQIKESITKFLDKETGTLGERIRTLFREQGITITSILTAIGMAIGVIVEALIPGSGSANTNSSNNGEDSGKDKKGGGAKEWIQNKLKALANLLGKLAYKASSVLPSIIGSIVSWILNRAKEVVGWLSQNIWALVVGVFTLVYTNFMTSDRRQIRRKRN